jgi:hypothetical protein
MEIQFPKSSILDRVLAVFIISATSWMIHFDSLPAGGFSRLPDKLRFLDYCTRQGLMKCPESVLYGCVYKE